MLASFCIASFWRWKLWTTRTDFFVAWLCPEHYDLHISGVEQVSFTACFWDDSSKPKGLVSKWLPDSDSLFRLKWRASLARLFLLQLLVFRILLLWFWSWPIRLSGCRYFRSESVGPLELEFCLIPHSNRIPLTTAVSLHRSTHCQTQCQQWANTYSINP